MMMRVILRIRHAPPSQNKAKGSFMTWKYIYVSPSAPFNIQTINMYHTTQITGHSTLARNFAIDRFLKFFRRQIQQ